MHYRIELQQDTNRSWIQSRENDHLYLFEEDCDNVILVVDRCTSFSLWGKATSKFYRDDKLILVSQLVMKFFGFGNVISIIEQHMQESLSFSSDNIGYTLTVGNNHYQIKKRNFWSNYEQVFLNGNAIATTRSKNDQYFLEFTTPNDLDINAALLYMMLLVTPAVYQ